jgi:hypothetical protein
VGQLPLSAHLGSEAQDHASVPQQMKLGVAALHCNEQHLKMMEACINNLFVCLFMVYLTTVSCSGYVVQNDRMNK